MSLLLAVPVKDLVNAKQRLIPALSPAERRELARAMLEDVLDAAAAALPGVGARGHHGPRGTGRRPRRGASCASPRAPTAATPPR